MPRIPWRSSMDHHVSGLEPGPRREALIGGAFVLGVAVGAVTGLLLTSKRRPVGVRAQPPTRRRPRRRAVQTRDESLTGLVRREAERVIRTLGDQLTDSIRRQVRGAFSPRSEDAASEGSAAQVR